jgi:hypothetical protein
MYWNEQRSCTGMDTQKKILKRNECSKDRFDLMHFYPSTNNNLEQ